jgi:hypothetical protein
VIILIPSPGNPLYGGVSSEAFEDYAGLFMSIGRPEKWKSCQAANRALIIVKVGGESAQFGA